MVENNKLKELALKLGIENIDMIPDRIESTKISDYLDYEELKTIYSKYLNIAIDEIPEEKYSKIEKENISLGDNTVEADGYQIKLKVKDIQPIYTKILEKAKDDEQVFNLINKFNNEDITFEDYQNNIDGILDNVSEEISDEEDIDFITISVYKQGKNTVKIYIKISEDSLSETYIDYSIEKTKDNMLMKINDVTLSELSDYNPPKRETSFIINKTLNKEEQENFEITKIIKDDDTEISNVKFNIERTGALTSNNVIFDISIPITSEDASVNIEFKNTSNFSAAPEFEEFNENNHLVINGLSQEQINNLITNLKNLLSEKLKDEMLVSIIKNDNLYQLVKEASQATQSAIEEETTLSEINEQTKEMFNMQFEVYEGTRKGAEIKSLIEAINTSNANDSEHTIAYGGVSQQSIESTKEYSVLFEKDGEGYINKAIIEEN